MRYGLMVSMTATVLATFLSTSHLYGGGLLERLTGLWNREPKQTAHPEWDASGADAPRTCPTCGERACAGDCGEAEGPIRKFGDFLTEKNRELWQGLYYHSQEHHKHLIHERYPPHDLANYGYYPTYWRRFPEWGYHIPPADVHEGIDLPSSPPSDLVPPAPGSTPELLRRELVPGNPDATPESGSESAPIPESAPAPESFPDMPPDPAQPAPSNDNSDAPAARNGNKPQAPASAPPLPMSARPSEEKPEHGSITPFLETERASGSSGWQPTAPRQSENTTPPFSPAEGKRTDFTDRFRPGN